MLFTVTHPLPEAKHTHTHTQTGYWQSKLVPSLWKHNSRPIQFTLVVDNFGIKYVVGEEHANHLKKVLKEHYKLMCDWTGPRYIGITLDWDYTKLHVHLLMPGLCQKH